MARQNTSGRESGSTATKNVPGNQTPNTPEVNESQIARLRVDQLRDRLRRRGVTGTGDMRKGELVDALVQALREGRKTTRSRAGSTSRDGAGARGGAGSRSGSGSRGSGSGSGPGRAGTGGRARGGSAARGRPAGKEQPGNQTPNTPEVNESEIARLKVDQLRDRLRRRGVTDTVDMRKADLVDALIRALREGRKTTRSGSGSRSGSAQGSRAAGGSRGRSSGKEQSGNQTPNTPEVNESEIARLKVDQLRDRLRRRGISGTAEMRKPELVDALIRALREGKTTRSGSGATARGGSNGSGGRSGPGRTTGSRSGSTGSGRSTGGSSANGGSRGRRSGEQQPGSQPANNELAHLEVDELRYLLRRRAVAGTSKMRKGQLVEALITALREGRRPEGDDRMAIPMPATPQTTGGSTPRARVTPEALPPAPVHAELAAAPATAALPAATERPDRAEQRGERGAARVPRPRTAPDDTEDAHLQPVRSSGSSNGEPTGSGPSVTAETADRVLTDLVPAEMEPVDEVVTPEGTVITGGATTAAVATPPLPTTDDR